MAIFHLFLLFKDFVMLNCYLKCLKVNGNKTLINFVFIKRLIVQNSQVPFNSCDFTVTSLERGEECDSKNQNRFFFMLLCMVLVKEHSWVRTYKI